MRSTGPRLCVLLLGLCAGACARDAAAARASAPDDEQGMGLGPTLDGTDPAPLASPSMGDDTAGSRAAADRPQSVIFRGELQRATERGPAYLLRQLAPEPFRHHGTFVGWEVTRVFPDDPQVCASGCDLQIGDVILSVNGSRLETPQQLSDAFDTLPRVDALVVHSLRDGKRRERTYRIVEDAP